jgi:O-antigen ligase
MQVLHDIRNKPILLISILFMAWPVWWIMGVEQFIWAPALLLIVVVTKIELIKIIRREPVVQALLVFILVQLISSLAIEKSFRYITFTRTLLTYLAALLLLIIGYSKRIQGNRLQAIAIKLVVFMVVAASVAGFLGLLGIWDGHFTSAAGLIAPDWLKNSGYGSTIAFRRFGTPAFVLGMKYFRLNSLFTFANTYSLFWVIVIPLLASSAIQKEPPGRYWMSLLLLAALIQLIFTTSRLAILALAITGTVALLEFGRRKASLRLVLSPQVIIAIAIASAILLLVLVVFVLPEALEGFLKFRGSSGYDRLEIYVRSILAIRARPLFGFGTERDFPGGAYPLGSHSTYFGHLFRFGAVGVLCWVLVLYSIIRQVWVSGESPLHKGQDSIIFSRGAKLSLLAVMLANWAYTLDLDATNMAVFWLIMAAMLRHQMDLKSRASQAEA